MILKSKITLVNTIHADFYEILQPIMKMWLYLTHLCAISTQCCFLSSVKYKRRTQVASLLLFSYMENKWG